LGAPLLPRKAGEEGRASGACPVTRGRGEKKIRPGTTRTAPFVIPRFLTTRPFSRGYASNDVFAICLSLRPAGAMRSIEPSVHRPNDQHVQWRKQEPVPGSAAPSGVTERRPSSQARMAIHCKTRQPNAGRVANPNCQRAGRFRLDRAAHFSDMGGAQTRFKPRFWGIITPRFPKLENLAKRFRQSLKASSARRRS
jgi:hypothetical protein